MHSTDTDAPIHHFSHCHVGILAQLSRLNELPALLAPAALARKTAEQSIAFFDEGMYEHHKEEEQELFPAVRSSAQAGPERLRVESLIEQLTAGHRQLEALWASLSPSLHKVAKGKDTLMDEAALARLVQQYREHARLEENEFLPLAETILGRNGNHMAALGLSLHMRHVPHFVAHI
ncbi:MAG: hemerythrin domain-containing protein [Betaproteobacteria bacterium]|nr:hemerythrin domain-containing protein [Betaproteobacteria bacterium]